MKFSFKIQQYQTDAVNAVVDVFKGQVRPAQDTSYFFDPGRLVPVKTQKAKNTNAYNLFQQELDEQEAKQDIILGYANAPIKLDKAQLLENIKHIQGNNNITPSKELIEGQGKCSLDIEMETGTGKTYVYIKTMFELNKQYGWNKFIIIVPSVAIREGVKKSLQTMEEHFMSQYGKKARYFIYDSKNLTKIDDFAKSNEINVMIINNQAFAKSLNEEKNKEGRGGDKGALIIYSERDEFGSRKPIDVIAKTNPILILDEPQKLNGPATQKAMKRFNPLFSVNYSATHKDKHNMVYVLDALDAYNQKLVKKIEVKGLEMKNLKGIDSYLYCEEIETSPIKPPRVRLEFEVQQTNSIKRVRKLLSEQDSLYALSNGMKQYEGYVINNIDPRGKGTVTFTNGEVLHCADVVGDVTELYKRRLQIRETLLSHFEKEKELYAQGIKTLSLFFIDKVENYRKYNEDGTQELGEYGKIFEEEYMRIFDSKSTELFKDDPYVQYLNRVAADVHDVHTGYFSIDKKGHSVDSKCERGKDTSNDESAYDLIMRNKEALLSFDNPVRFIFSHSALREGWDNPNIFQICTLKASNSDVNKRQEVGRGMRLCVNQQGERMDLLTCGEAMVHKINQLTVVTSESYADFVGSLQDDMKAALYKRPTHASIDYFADRTVKVDGKQYKIEREQAGTIMLYLGVNGYADYDGKITEKYKADKEAKDFAPLPPQLEELAPAIHKLIQGIFDEEVLKMMVADAKETKVKANPLNANFDKAEFQALWNRINHK
ncbi:DEAD/DEAH box helicase family protein, partial [Phascolarctobacterium succinatutens]|uniref:DEAD/DEAH box helicase family protein n=1 Tax=Phascolarctobacterium succinatutens TaxID=626940 RepID=UPI0026F26F8F